MANTYRGQTRLPVGDQELILVFDWSALAEVRLTLGSDGQAQALAGDLPLLAQMISIGLKKHHPDWSADDVMEASPPVTPTIDIVDKAMISAYFGPNGMPEELGENPQKPLLTPLKRVWQWLIRSA